MTRIKRPHLPDSHFVVKSVRSNGEFDRITFNTYRVAKAAYLDAVKPYNGKVYLYEHGEIGAYETLDTRIFQLAERS